MISDNEENSTLHEKNICNDRAWAGIMDVIALVDILKTNIVMMIQVNTGYIVQPFIFSKKAKTIFVKFNGTNHFEPLLPSFNVKSPSVSASSYSKSPKSPKFSKYLGKSISSETRRLIEQMDSKTNSGKSISSETRQLIKQMDSPDVGRCKKRKYKIHGASKKKGK